MPPARVFGHKRRPLWVALFLLPLVLVAVWLFVPVWYVEVLDRDSGKKYFAQHVEEDDPVRLSWVHSIEHTPWVETYQVSSGQFALKESRVKSFGAGVDQIAPDVASENGWIAMRGTGRVFPALHFIYSREAAYDLRIDGRKLALAGRVPHHAAIRVEMEQSPRVLWWFRQNIRER